MSDEIHHGLFAGLIGLFPLPNAVLLPGATQALQIFEPRYRAMVEDVLAGAGLLAMALLQPGYEPVYHSNAAEIHPVLCAGRIREHVKVPDGRYFINLVGLCRARVLQEDHQGLYRRALLDPLVQTPTGLAPDQEHAIREYLRRRLAAPIFNTLK